MTGEMVRPHYEDVQNEREITREVLCLPKHSLKHPNSAISPKLAKWGEMGVIVLPIFGRFFAR